MNCSSGAISPLFQNIFIIYFKLKESNYMFIGEIWLFDWYFHQFCKSDMSKYGYLEVFQGPFDFEMRRVDCMFFGLLVYYNAQ